MPTVTAHVERYVDRRDRTPTEIRYWPLKGENADFRPREPQYVMPRCDAEGFAEILRSCGNEVRLTPEKAKRP